jgi:hypothetical protein
VPEATCHAGRRLPRLRGRKVTPRRPDRSNARAFKEAGRRIVHQLVIRRETARDLHRLAQILTERDVAEMNLLLSV